MAICSFRRRSMQATTADDDDDDDVRPRGALLRGRTLFFLAGAGMFQKVGEQTVFEHLPNVAIEVFPRAALK